MAFTVKFKELGMTKPSEIKVTNRVLKETLAMQSAIGAAQDKLINGEVENVFDVMLDLIDVKKDYLKYILKLSEKQLEKFDELEQVESDTIIGELTNKVLGIEEDDSDDQDSEGKE